MQRATPGADEERPKVKSFAASESIEDDQVQLNGIRPCYGRACSKNTIFNWIILESTCHTCRRARYQVEHGRGFQACGTALLMGTTRCLTNKQEVEGGRDILEGL